MRSMHKQMCGGALESFRFDTKIRMGVGGQTPRRFSPHRQLPRPQWRGSYRVGWCLKRGGVKGLAAA